ncbi:MAG: Ppx/GppA phosphatase family protein [Bacteroidota bacterium]|jgi:exopolyphosphatase/guanosine-5'-triphosphate,3'-diphosphate pyrophosphatase
MRIASIDIGTNTILLLIADVTSTGIHRVVHDEQVIARLGKGVDAARMISPGTFRRVTAFLADYKKRCGEFRVDVIIATGTSALRDAANSGEFCQFVLEQTGISIEIISGEEEAHWTYRGGISEFAHRSNSFSVIDIGGGSTEIIVGDARVIAQKTSLNIGSVRITERFLKTSPPDKESIAEAQHFVKSLMPHEILRIIPSTLAIGVAGTATTLAAIQQRLPLYEPSKISGFQLSPSMVRSMLEDLRGKNIEEIKSIPQISEGRADIIVAGIIILLEFMEAANLQTLTVSDRGLRYGIVLREIEKAH